MYFSINCVIFHVGKDGNFVASPMSILVLLSALLSAKGPQEEAARQICKPLVGNKKSSTCLDDPSYAEVTKMLNNIRTGIESAKSPDGKRVVRLSNAVFVAPSMKFKESFARDFAIFEGDKVMKVPFNGTEAFNSINAWAAGATNGLISQYLKSPQELSPDTLMVLLNALAFSGRPIS